MNEENMRAAKVISTLILTGIILGFWASNATASEWDWSALMKYGHTSDILRGCPLECNDAFEPTLDYIGFGTTLSSPRRVLEIDFTHGVRAINCTTRHRCDTEPGTEFTIRFYPGRWWAR